MKYLFLLMILCSCGKPSSNVTPIVTAVDPLATSCKIYDACTYETINGQKQPVYSCAQKIYDSVDNPQISSKYFAGNTCLAVREDFDPNTGNQGPGPKAIPEIGL